MNVSLSTIFFRPTARGIALASMLVLLSQQSSAEVFTTGDVTPSDNILTEIGELNENGLAGFEGIQEWIPYFGDIFDPPEPGDPANQATFAHPADIVVGQRGYGAVTINGSSEVRYQHLVLGGGGVDFEENPSLLDAQGSDATAGIGVFRVEGFGSLFNSDKSLFPPGIAVEDREIDGPGGDPVLLTGEDALDDTPRPGMSGAVGPGGEPAGDRGGFDAYVGYLGSGTMVAAEGGRYEIEDAVVAGFAVGSYGEILIDGFGSHVDQRGGAGTQAGVVSGTLIGVLGTGVLNVQNSGQFDSRGGAAIGGQEVGGEGVATVDGLGSNWRVNGRMTVGFYNEAETAMTVADPVVPSPYGPGPGTGILTVSDRATVTVYGEETYTTAELQIGREGTLVLDNGKVFVDGRTNNHHVISGHGRIEATHFLNAGYAEVMVEEAQKLTVVSTDALTSGASDYFVNYGVVRVTGGEFEFVRSSLATPVQNVAGDRFWNSDQNAPVADSQVERENGLIHAQDAILRFQTGLLNDGILAFTAGHNIVRGDVENGSPDGAISGDVGGVIMGTGGSNIVFEDDLLSDGVINLGGDDTVVSTTIMGDFINGPNAELRLNFGVSGSSGGQFSGISVAGDIDLGGTLVIGGSSTLLSGANLQAGDEFAIIRGSSMTTMDLVGEVYPTLPNNLLFDVKLVDDDIILFVTDDVANQSDFNGDGIVDALDLQIWRDNFGLLMGARGIDGDANGDGRVDILDYYLWLEQLGTSPAAIVSTVSQVPEPSAVVLAIFGGVAVVAARRRRAVAR